MLFIILVFIKLLLKIEIRLKKSFLFSFYNI